MRKTLWNEPIDGGAADDRRPTSITVATKTKAMKPAATEAAMTAGLRKRVRARFGERRDRWTDGRGREVAVKRGTEEGEGRRRGAMSRLGWKLQT